MSNLKTISLGIAMIYLLLAACSKKQAEEIKPDEPGVPGVPATPVTYSATIQPLLQSRCAGCHSPGRQGSGAWTFNGYTTVTGNADNIKRVVLVTKTMPPGGSLSAADQKSLQDWFDQGMPQ